MKKTFFASILTITLCLCLISGATFALFTSESKTNITIQSGTVKVVSEVDKIELYSLDKLQTETFENGGTASLVDNKINLQYMTPGDKVVAHIKVNNESNVKIKYRIYISDDGSKLQEALQYSLTCETENVELGHWHLLDANADITDLSLSIELPLETGNDYQNLSSEIVVLIEAVQGNAEVPTYITTKNLSTTDFTQEKTEFVLLGKFEEINIAKLGEGSTLTFDNVTATKVVLNGKNTIIGNNTLSCSLTTNGTKDVPAELIITDATLNMGATKSLESKIVDDVIEGTAKLTIENSEVYCGSIYVGGHTNNQPKVTAELSIRNSYVSCEENSLGSTISVWGQNLVNAEILDSEVHTYSRGWHQSDDANDNSITFQGGGTINVNIERSNMHLYGARSIINARKYNSDATINFNINESLIWVVTKSSHGEETLPVWNYTEIKNSVLVFTKNVHNNSTPAVIKSWVYGNPVISGDYKVTTQCQWETAINVPDGQTITFNSNANVSIYEGASAVDFVLSGTAKIILKEGAVLSNIGIKAAEGYTLNTVTENGETIYTVTVE